ncbi:MAG: sulfatase [Lachnospiraceae bacterium]|nr:sulfatase [Candidatus Fimimorpha excrementavium]
MHQSSSKPNLLFVLPDEFRRDAIGCMKKDPVHTPNIDRFVSESMDFPNAVSTYPVCSPYRGQLFTGCYPFTNGVVGNCNTSTAPFGVYLTSRKVCLSDLFHEAGYDCGYVGKWHLSAPEPKDFPYLEPRREDGKVWDAYTPVSQRHHFRFWYSYGCNDQHFHPHYWFNDDAADQVRQVDEWAPRHEADMVIRYLENEHGAMRDPDKPFLLFWAPNPPHMPFDQVPEEYQTPYEGKEAEDLLTNPNARAGCTPPPAYDFAGKNYPALHETARDSVKHYFSCVTGIDDQFGRILKTLEETGLKDNTIVIFTSDHGELMGSHSLMYKGEWYRECYQVPFFLRWPGHIPAHSTCRAFLNPPDIMPTLLDLCGLSSLIPASIEGVSRAGWIRASMDSSSGDLQTSMDPGEGFYNNPQMNARGVCNEQYMLVVFRDRYDRETCLLYDQINDPCQLHDCASSHPEVVKQMRLRLDDWLRRTNDLWIR